MVVSIIGTLLSFISVLQNLTKKKTLQEKVIDLRFACNELDLIYYILSESKKTHNEFQKFENAALQSFKKLIRSKSKLVSNEIEDEINLFIELTKQLIRVGELTYNEIENPESNGNSLPVEIIKNSTEVARKYPVLVDSLNTFYLNFEQLKLLSKSKNFGDDLDENILNIENSVKNILNIADDVILNTAPILDFIHFKIKETLNQLV